MDIMKRINDLCRERNLSKYRLSLLTGISQSAFSKMERQQSTLSIDTIQRICDALGISLAQFFSEDDELPDLSSDQKQLLKSWSLLNPDKRLFVKHIIDELEQL